MLCCIGAQVSCRLLVDDANKLLQLNLWTRATEHSGQQQPKKDAPQIVMKIQHFGNVISFLFFFQKSVTSSFHSKKDIVFPPESVEATPPVLHKRKRLTYKDVCKWTFVNKRSSSIN